MKWTKRNVLILVSALVVVIVAVISSVVYVNAKGESSTNSLQPSSISTKAALVLPKESQCATNDVAIKTQVEALKGLGEEDGLWTSYIYDVPAGVNVDVNIATYNGSDTVAGSLVYPEAYGSYNFTVTKQIDDTWLYSQFAGCK